MSILHNIYKNSLAENERNLKFWEDYYNNLNSLDFSAFSEKLSVPILVPIGNKILFRGALKHTNEVTVALGADYFAKCSVKQAEILRQHRIKVAQSKIQSYIAEKEYLENQFHNHNLQDQGFDIIETCSEEEDRLWREKHRERVRKYNQSSEKKKEREQAEIADNDLWARLEELELQEELEEEYLSMTNRESSEADNSFVLKDEDKIKFSQDETVGEDATLKQNNLKVNPDYESNSDTQSSKVHLLQEVIERQKLLETKLTQLKNKERVSTKTEKDLYDKLDELEALDEVEDEIDRLDDILNEDSDDTGNSSEEVSTSSRKTVSFADEDESETLELEFKHSDVKPDTIPYNPRVGITKPSDVYEAFSHCFTDEAVSILKKTKYIDSTVSSNDMKENVIKKDAEMEARETIIVKDVLEKVDNMETSKNQERPVSLFKKRRQNKK